MTSQSVSCIPSLFSTALSNLANSRPVHSLVLSFWYWWISIGLVIGHLRAVFCPSDFRQSQRTFHMCSFPLPFSCTWDFMPSYWRVYLFSFVEQCKTELLCSKDVRTQVLSNSEQFSLCYSAIFSFYIVFMFFHVHASVIRNIYLLFGNLLGRELRIPPYWKLSTYLFLIYVYTENICLFLRYSFSCLFA